jgi:MHS family proline/betaine transporter-like MFS transporter
MSVFVPTIRAAPPGAARIYLGNLAEWYDFATFGASAALLGVVVTAGRGGLTSVFVVLAGALLVRPIGSVLVGHFSDRAGRRLPFLVTTLSTCAATAAVGLLPSAATAGLFAVAALAVLRIVQAFGTGGETSTSVSYLFEEAAPERKGLYGGLYLSSAAAGMAGGVAVVLLVQLLLTRAQLLQWGWRLPFLAAVPLALAVFWLRRRLEESPEFGAARGGLGSGVYGPVGRGRSVPALALSDVVGLTRRQCSTVVSGALLAGAFAATVNVWFVFLPAYLLVTGRATVAAALGPTVVGLAACAILAPAAGHVSDRLGPVPVLFCACAGLCLLWPAAFPRVLAGAGWTFFTVASLAMGIALSAFVLPAHLSQAFAAEDRALGLGLTLGVGSGVFGGLATLLATSLAADHRPEAIVALPPLCAVSAAAALALATRRHPVSPPPAEEADEVGPRGDVRPGEVRAAASKHAGRRRRDSAHRR